MQACVRCHQRKVRCDKLHPCRRCQQSGIECTYSDRPKERLFSQERVDSLESKLRRVESRNRVLSQELARARSAAISSPAGTGSLPSTTSHPHGDVFTEVSTLAINASGERHYLGSASGVLLADFVRAHVDAGPPQVSAEAVLVSGDNGIASGAATPAVREYDPGWSSLPSRQLAKRLVVAYLGHDHICYPVIHPAFLLSVLDSTYDAGRSFYDQHPFEAFVLNMVLAIATTHALTFDWQMLPSAESHHARAVSSVPAVLQQGGLRSLQAMLLLTQYRMSSSVHDNTASMWHLVGMASRLAIQLGLHRQDMYPHQLENCTVETGDESKLIEQEIARNCFWSTISMDRIVSNILGRPFSIQMSDVDAQLPTKESDEVMALGLSEKLASHRGLSGAADTFIHIVRYRLLCGKIVATMHGQPGRVTQDESIISLRDGLAEDVTQWGQRTLDLVFPPETASSSCFRSKAWFDMLFHNAMLMLYRPSPKLDVSQDADALQKIFSSAKESITLYSALHRSRRLNHSWLSLQAIFMSGLSYIFAASMHFRDRQRVNSSFNPHLVSRQGPLGRDPTTIEVVNDTRACSNVLIAVSERWSALRHCSEVFNRLSDAVLTDVIKFECDPRGASRRSGTATPRRQDVVPPAPAPLNGLLQDDAPSAPWDYPGSESIQGIEPVMSPLSQLAVDTEFRHTFDHLQLLYDREQIDYSASQLTQAWYDICI